MFRVFVHVHYHHAKKISEIGAEQLIFSCYAHFFYFVREFDLIAPKELRPLADLTKSLNLKF